MHDHALRRKCDRWCNCNNHAGYELQSVYLFRGDSMSGVGFSLRPVFVVYIWFESFFLCYIFLLLLDYQVCLGRYI